MKPAKIIDGLNETTDRGREQSNDDKLSSYSYSQSMAKSTTFIGRNGY